MGAYLKNIPKYMCKHCLRKASVIVCNTLNAPVGEFCFACGRKEVRRMERAEKGLGQR